DERIAALAPEKRALFAKLMREQSREENAFPISVMQQGIWFLEQLKPHNPAYVIPAAVRISGPLDAGVLRAAVNEIVRRHEPLRTTFRLREGRPAQVVAAELTLDRPEVDLRSAGDLATQIDATLHEPFDLAAGPLLRVRLLRTGDEEYVLVVAMHHLISDGWSVGILVAELSALYEAYLAGRPCPLPDLAIQYGDFATWQQRWLREADLGADLAYWRAHLAGAPPVLELPTDRPRPAVQGFNGASVPFELPATVLGRLDGLAKRHGATTYMALLAVFQILLHRYSNQDDIVVGVPMANRTRFDLELQFFADDGALRGWFEYDRDLFDESTMARLAGHFRRLTELVLVHPDQPVDLLPLLDAVERQRILHQGNATGRSWPD